MGKLDEQFTDLVENSPIAMIVSSGIDEQVLFLNQKFTSLFGYSIKEIPDVSHWWRLAYPDERYREEIRSQWTTRTAKAIREKGEIEPLEANVTCKDGSQRHIQFSFSSIGEKNLVMFTDMTERRLAENALQETAARLNEAQRIAHIGSWELDIVNNVLVWSDEIYHMFEIDREKFGASYEAFLDTIHPDDRKAVDVAYTDSLKTRTPYSIEHRLLFPDGRIKYVHERCETYFDNGKAIRSVGTVQDITERKQVEMKLSSTNRMLQTLSDTNQALIRIADETELLNEVCRIAVEVGGYRMAWVAFAEQDEAKTLRPMAHAGFESGYIKSARLSWADNERGRGPGGTAIRSGEPCLARNIHTDPSFAPWREEAEKRGYQAVIALPLVSEGRAFGVLGIYSAEVDAFDDRESEILNELASDLAFGITVLRSRAKRDQAEEALRKSEEEYRTLLQKIQAAVVVHGADTQILTSNALAQELLGLSEEQLRGKKAIDADWHFFHEDGTELSHEEYPVNQVLEKRTALRNLICGIHRANEGSDAWFLINADPVVDKEDVLTQVIVTFIDITERVHAERELRDSEEKFAAAFHATPNLMAITRIADGTILEVNEGYTRLLGYSHDESIGKTTTELSIWADPDDRATFVTTLEESGQITDFETTLRRKDGAIVTVIDSARTIEFRGEPCVLSVVHDISDRVRAEEALRQSEERFRRLAENAPDVIYRMSLPDGNYEYVSPAAAEVLGYSPEELYADPILFQRSIHPDWQEYFRKQWAELVQGRMPPTYEYQIIHRSGEVRWLNQRNILVRDSSGNPSAIEGIVTDISESRQAEEERQANLGFFENMDKVNRAIQGAADVDGMMSDVLATVLEIFDCDRAWLFYPCDPDAPVFRVPMEVTRPEYPGAKTFNVDLPMPPDMAENLREALESADPLTYTIGTEKPVNKVSAEQFGVMSQMMVALYPKAGKPWVFGLHQCSDARVWTQEEQRLFQEISRRLTDGLTGLLSLNELRESENRYRQIVDTANEGIMMLGEDLLITFVNARMAAMLGYQVEKIIGKPTTTFMFEEDATDYLEKMDERRKGLSEVFERRFRHKNGQVVWTLASAVPSFDAEMNFKGTFGMFTDITERKKAEQALQISEAGFREAQHLAQVGSWDWDAINDTIFWSDEYYRIYGFEIGSPPIGYEEHLKAYTPESIERLDAVVKKAMEDGTPYELDLELAQPTSTTRWISARGEAKRDADGKIVGLRGTAQNITDRKRAEEAVRLSEAEYRTLFEDSKDTVIMTSPEGEIQDINAAGVELLGYGSREELLKVNIAQAVYAHPEDRKSMLDDLQRQGYLKNYDLEFHTKDGKKLYLSASLTSMLDKDGKIIAIRGILHDMTEHRRLEEQLRQSQKLESIGMLAGGVAHDFNNYLTAIEGYTDLAMLELSEDSTAYKELQEARHSSDRAANLARQLLLFSRREPMHPKPVSLNAVITDLLKMLGRLIGEQYRLVTHLGEGLWTINADATHIEQVIMNLVVNARDAMPGGGEITIRTGNLPVDAEYAGTHPGSQPGEFVHLQIEDSGCGMDAETISHIFEPFFTTKAAAYGTGLGLSVVYGIVTQHGGWIDVESTPGQGTIFNISLPALPFQTASVESEDIPIEQLQGQGERILLVEDEGVVRELAEKMLARNGYSVTVAADAEEAEAVFDDLQGDFDLVFSDVILPKENGVTLVGHLLEDKPELKVLLASGYSDISGRETIQEKGYPFLQKPYQLQVLLKQLRELLDQPRLPA